MSGELFSGAALATPMFVLAPGESGNGKGLIGRVAGGYIRGGGVEGRNSGLGGPGVAPRAVAEAETEGRATCRSSKLGMPKLLTPPLLLRAPEAAGVGGAAGMISLALLGNMNGFVLER